MRLLDARRDYYRKLAKELGYKSRATFKLIEANEKYGFLREGIKVLDFGSAPGGWLQFTSEHVGPRGIVVGIDIKQIEVQAKNVFFIMSDIFAQEVEEKIRNVFPGPYEVILSDIAPNTSGIWELDHNRQLDMSKRVLELSYIFLHRRGSLFMKLFQGERLMEFVALLKTKFYFVDIFKPKASRKESSEVYAYCKNLRL